MMTTISNSPNQPTHRAVILTVVKILAVICVAETAVMVILQAANLTDGWRTVLDPIMLAGLTMPLLYRFVVGLIGDARQQRRQAERRLKEAAAALKSSNKVMEEFKNTAETTTQAKSEYLANMSREMRTPITAILGHLDVIAEGCPKQCDFGKSETAGHIDNIKRNSDCLLGLIDNILHLARIEAGKMEIGQVTCWPCRIVSDVVLPGSTNDMESHENHANDRQQHPQDGCTGTETDFSTLSAAPISIDGGAPEPTVSHR